MFPSVNKAEVHWSLLSETDSEEDFVEAAVNLLVEATSYLTIAGCVSSHEAGWTRNQAVVGGNLVRLTKLSQGLLDVTCQRRRELSEAISRMIFETSVNSIFLMRFSSDELVQSYIDHSLGFERKLKKQIRERMAERNDSILPIEKRMLSSIDRLATASGVDLDAAHDRRANWGGKNFYEKAKAIGWSDAYIGAFAGTSIAIHGGWGDLAAHHLEKFDGSGFYKPVFEWSRPRPQHLLTLGQILLVVATEFLEFVTEKEDIHSDELDDVIDRICAVREYHEDFLVRTGDT